VERQPISVAALRRWAGRGEPHRGLDGHDHCRRAVCHLAAGRVLRERSGLRRPRQCEGDATGDGRVDDADLLEVLFNFGCFGFCGSADVDHNGTVDDADLLIVLFNFGCGS
jgi:hypothetical protein